MCCKNTDITRHNIADFYTLIIPDEVTKLKRVLEIIKKWEIISNSELDSIFQNQSEQEQKKVAIDYDYEPVNDEAFIIHQSTRVIYANLAVTVTASVEKFIDYFYQSQKAIFKDNPNDYSYNRKQECLERQCKIKFDQIDGFKLTQKARIMGNCFKHNAGNANEVFAKKFDVSLGESIYFEKENWLEIIVATECFLVCLVSKLHKYNEEQFAMAI